MGIYEKMSSDVVAIVEHNADDYAYIHKYARPEDVPEHTIFIITTDGMENAFRNYDSRISKCIVENPNAFQNESLRFHIDFYMVDFIKK